MKKISTTLLIAATIITGNIYTSSAQDWHIKGNSGTNADSNFVGTIDSKGLTFRTFNVERMRLTTGGNLNLGSLTPGSAPRLAVVGTSVASLTSPGYVMLGINSSSNMVLDYNVIQARYNGAGSGLYLNYYGGSTWLGSHSGSAIPAVYANADGRVGIGSSNTTSGYALTVNSGSLSGLNVTDPADGYILQSTKSGVGYGIYVSKTSTSSSTATIYSSTSGTGQGLYGYSSSGIGLYGANGSGTANGVYGYSPGGSGSNGTYGYCGGIGTGVTGYCIDGSGVSGYSANYIGVYGKTGNSSLYAGYFDGDVYTTGSYLPSDQKLKQNIKDVSGAITIINQLQPKQYQYRQDGNYKMMNLPKGNRFGLIAEDVEKVLPNLVKASKYEIRTSQNEAIDPKNAATESQNSTATQKKSETIDFKAVNYTELIPIIIKGMQEQQQVIDKQQQVNEQLQQEISELKQMVQTLTGKNISNSTVVAASLSQNTPNPFNADTRIQCTVPSTAKAAQLIISTQDGKQLQLYTINSKGNSVLIIHGSTLPAGQYLYSLVIDGKIADTKTMILSR